MTEVYDKSEFDDHIQSDEHVCALFTADWCPDCRILKPVMPELEKDFASSFKFITLDRDRFLDLCQEQNVFGIPSFITYKNGTETGRFVSTRAKSREEIEEFLKKAQGS